jgi:hypothetical protein
MAIVTLYDINEYDVSCWAIENCSSFSGWLIYENDVLFDEQPDWQISYEFEFADEQEAMLFQLRWQGQ